MKHLKESLLSDMEDTLSRGEQDLIDALQLPTIKDFIKNPYNTKMHSVKWMCTDIINKYKQKYPSMIADEFIGFELMLDASWSRVVDLHIYLTNSRDFVSHKKVLPGWYDTFIGSDVRTYKKMTIDIIKALAKNPDILDKLMDHAFKSWKLSKSNKSELTDVYGLYSLAIENKLKQV